MNVCCFIHNHWEDSNNENGRRDVFYSRIRRILKDHRCVHASNAFFIERHNVVRNEQDYFPHCSSLIHLFPDNISIHSMTILRFPVVRCCFSEELRLSTIIVFTDRGCKKKHVLSTKEKLRLKEVKRCWFLNPRYF